MARAFLMAFGIAACIFGAECMAVDRFVLVGDKTERAPEPVSFFGSPPNPAAATREYKPPEWMAWTFLSGGAIVILYSLAMRQE
ncbi:MAG TPA: hypothetical protein VMP01_05750 [Pirellulaceae bacterium]|nr:hypothetical protein [Pirellulaceae bacterium]